MDLNTHMFSMIQHNSVTCPASTRAKSGISGSIKCHASARDTPVKPIVVVGSVNADLVVKLDRLPKPGETIAGSSLEFYPGGKGANQAAAAAKLGYPTYFIGQVRAGFRDNLLNIVFMQLVEARPDLQLQGTVQVVLADSWLPYLNIYFSGQV